MAAWGGVIQGGKQNNLSGPPVPEEEEEWVEVRGPMYSMPMCVWEILSIERNMSIDVRQASCGVFTRMRQKTAASTKKRANSWNTTNHTRVTHWGRK